MARYTGPRARLLGLVWGSLFATVGTGGFLFFVTAFGLVPPAVQRVVVGMTPLTDGMAGPTPRRLVPFALIGVLSLGTAVFACYGLYEIGRAVLEDDYAIELTVEGGAGGGV